MKNSRGFIQFIFLGIAAIIVIFYLLFHFGFFGAIGALDKKNFDTSPCMVNSCNFSAFEKEYGSGVSYFSYCVGDAKFMVKDFNDWMVPIDLRTCKIVEDKLASSNAFLYAYYAQGIRLQSQTIYDKLLTCTEDFHGLAGVCKATTTFSNIASGPVLTILSYLPENEIPGVVSKLTANEYQEIVPIASHGVRLAKILNGTTIYLDITSAATCTFENTQQEIIFQISNNINETYSNARILNFSSNSYAQINQANTAIIDLLNVTDIPSRILQFDKELRDPECKTDKQKEVISKFQASVQDVDTNSDLSNEQFLTVLLERKRFADESMSAMQIAYNESTPDIGKWFILPTKALWFYLGYHLGNQAKNDYSNQLYFSAASHAKEISEKYSTFWNQTSIIHILFTIILYSGIGFIVWVFFQESKKSQISSGEIV